MYRHKQSGHSPRPQAHSHSVKTINALLFLTLTLALLSFCLGLHSSALVLCQVQEAAGRQTIELLGLVLS